MSNDAQRKALGRGLESLLPGSPVTAAPPAKLEGSQEIPIDQIDRNPYQTRSRIDEIALAELAASIAATGVVQPIVVRPIQGRFQLIAGERRWLASRKAGKATVPAVVRQVSNEQAMEMTIVENLQREDLNAMEQARAYDRLAREFHLTQEQMAQRTGKDRASVANFLRLLKLPGEVQSWVEAGDLSFGHAKVLLALETPEAIAKTAGKVRNLSLSVRQTEALVQGILNPEREGKEKAKEQAVDPNVRAAALEVQRALGVKVTIHDKGGKGKIVVEYASLEDFDRIVEQLSR